MNIFKKGAEQIVKGVKQAAEGACKCKCKHQAPEKGHISPISQVPTEKLSENIEKYVENKLKNNLKAQNVAVQDVTHGPCGKMYEIYVESPLFKDKSLIEQHQMVTDTLRNDMQGWHGYKIKTVYKE